MSGSCCATEVSRRVDPVRELDEVIRLIQFLGNSKPGGFTATLGWAEERLRAVREAVAAHASECSEFAAEESRVKSFPLLSNLAVLYGEART